MSLLSRVAGQFIIPDVNQGDKQSESQTRQSSFITAKVIDFISDPKNLSQSKIELLKLSVTNSSLINSMPINSIWCQIIEANRLDQHIAYPFFPGHLCLPIKPAEQVWIFYSELDRVYYWICRKTGDYISEDTNYTHIDRIVNAPIIVGTPGNEPQISAKDAYNGVTSQASFPQGRTDSIYNKTSGIFFDDKEIIDQSQEYQEKFIQEAVPRLVRQPGDMVIQGSNNTSVILGTSVNSPGKGIVDIVAGRDLKTAPVINTRNNQEVDKTRPAVTDGQVDFLNDDARVYLGMNENADLDFNVSINGIGGSGDGSCVVLKSDQIRLVATKDVKITVGDTGAGIVIKPDGNIVIVPSATGVIKLGGDDANKAILCQEAVQLVPGSVQAPSIISTAGGIIGAPDIIGTGIFASKILVK